MNRIALRKATRCEEETATVIKPPDKRRGRNEGAKYDLHFESGKKILAREKIHVKKGTKSGRS
jgi:hypothetical protein